MTDVVLCCRCKYWKPELQTPSQGVCQRYPPVAHFIPPGQMMVRQPVTLSGMGCAEGKINLEK